MGPTRLRKQTATGEGKKFHLESPSHQRFLSLVLLLLNSWESDYSEFCSAPMLFCATLFLVEPITASTSSLILMRLCFLLCMLSITSVPSGFITKFFFVRNCISEAQDRGVCNKSRIFNEKGGWVQGSPPLPTPAPAQPCLHTALTPKPFGPWDITSPQTSLYSQIQLINLIITVTPEHA